MTQYTHMGAWACPACHSYFDSGPVQCPDCHVPLIDPFDEIESLLNYKERMWEWKARAQLFARKVRAIKEFQQNTPTTHSTPYYAFLLKMELDKEMK